MIIITAVLVLFFAFASSIKLTGWQKFIFDTQLSFFNSYGLNRTHMFLVGIIEFSAALLLIFSLLFESNITNAAGALIILFASLGATFFHFKFDAFKDAIPALTTFSLSLYLLVTSPEIVIILNR